MSLQGSARTLRHLVAPQQLRQRVGLDAAWPQRQRSQDEALFGTERRVGTDDLNGTEDPDADLRHWHTPDSRLPPGPKA